MLARDVGGPRLHLAALHLDRATADQGRDTGSAGQNNLGIAGADDGATDSLS